ncbi:MAG: PQQ-like beta-propeller repeat protein [Spirochaetales bacterium]|nr:PQQ-like beta-propeller repeat protein [Spirochaetales bacterium]
MKKPVKILLTILACLGGIMLIIGVIVGINQLIVMANEQGAAISDEGQINVNNSYPGEDWPGWRGPHGDGTTTESGWTYDTTVISRLWEKNIGKGYSSPAVVDGKVYISGNSKKEDSIYCLDLLTGTEVWSFSYKCSPGEYAGPRSSPLFHEGFLYSISRDGAVYCLDADNGTVIWSVLVADTFSMPPHKWGYACSPVIYKNLLIINAGKGGIALDAKTGKMVWQNGGGDGGYSSPVIYTHNEETFIALFTGSSLISVIPENGAIQWEYPWDTDPAVNAADPLIIGTKAFISSFYGKGCALIDFSQNPPETLWKNNNMSSHFSSFYQRDGFIYGFDATPVLPFTGEFRCLSLETGKVVWQEKLGFGSFIVANTYFIILLQPGTIKIAEVDHKKYSEVASLTIKRGVFWTSPVLSHGILLLRSSGGDVTAISLRS